MAGLSLHVLEGEEVIGHLRGSGHLTSSLQAQYQEVQHQPVVLHYEGGKLETTDDPVRVGMVHVLGIGGVAVKRGGAYDINDCIYMLQLDVWI